MKRKPYLSLLLALALLGGMLALFPTLWMLLVIALLALISLQTALVRRNLYRLPAGAQPSAGVAVATPTAPAPAPAAPLAGATSAPSPASPAPVAAAPPTPLPAAPVDASPPPVAAPQPAVPTVASERPPQAPPGDAPSASAAPVAPAASSPPPPHAERPRADIDATLFSRFRKHLEQVEAKGDGARPAPAEAPARPAPPPPLPDDGEVQDRVELSGAARQAQPAKPAPAPSSGAPTEAPPVATAPPPTPVLPEAPKPRTSRRAKPTMARTPESEPESADLFADLRPVLPGTPGQDGAPHAAAGDDVGAALAGAQRDTPALADEAAALLRLAEEASVRGDWEGLRAGLYNYRAHLADTPALVDERARRLHVRLALRDGDTDGALRGFEDLLQRGPRPALDDVPVLLGELLDAAEPSAAAGLRVSMLVRILAGMRQARDQLGMDRCYGWIEEAQEQVGDERRLLQYLKNHLEIRKALGDVPGQLELIDQLGNRCYRLGLTDDARTWYEMGLRLRGEVPDKPPTPRRAGGAVGEG